MKANDGVAMCSLQDNTGPFLPYKMNARMFLKVQSIVGFVFILFVTEYMFSFLRHPLLDSIMCTQTTSGLLSCYLWSLDFERDTPASLKKRAWSVMAAV